MECVGTVQDILMYCARVKDREKLWRLTDYKPKRSLSANAYFHRLVGLLAKGEGARFYEKKNELIMQYGNHKFVRKESGKADYHFLEDGDDWKADPVYHYYPTKYTDDFCGRKIRAYMMFEGTHTYTSAEMAHLIDCTRNECLGSGIPLEEVETYEEHRLFERLCNAPQD